MHNLLTSNFLYGSCYNVTFYSSRNSRNHYNNNNNNNNHHHHHHRVFVYIKYRYIIYPNNLMFKHIIIIIINETQNSLSIIFI